MSPLERPTCAGDRDPNQDEAAPWALPWTRPPRASLSEPTQVSQRQQRGPAGTLHRPGCHLEPCGLRRGSRRGPGSADAGSVALSPFSVQRLCWGGNLARPAVSVSTGHRVEPLLPRSLPGQPRHLGRAQAQEQPGPQLSRRPQDPAPCPRGLGFRVWCPGLKRGREGWARADLISLVPSSADRCLAVPALGRRGHACASPCVHISSVCAPGSG